MLLVTPELSTITVVRRRSDRQGQARPDQARLSAPSQTAPETPTGKQPLASARAAGSSTGSAGHRSAKEGDAAHAQEQAVDVGPAAGSLSGGSRQIVAPAAPSALEGGAAAREAKAWPRPTCRDHAGGQAAEIVARVLREPVDSFFEHQAPPLLSIVADQRHELPRPDAEGHYRG